MNRLLKDTAIYGVGDFIFKFVSFAVFPIYANLFSVEQFGVLALVLTSASLVGLVLNLGLNNAVQRYYFEPNILEEQRPVLVSTGLVVLLLWASLVTALLLFGLHPFRDALDQRYDIEWLFLVLALSANLPSVVITYCLDVLRLRVTAPGPPQLVAQRPVSGQDAQVLLDGFGSRGEDVALVQIAVAPNHPVIGLVLQVSENWKP